jgi:hypothetical protein
MRKPAKGLPSRFPDPFVISPPSAASDDHSGDLGPYFRCVAKLAGLAVLMLIMPPIIQDGLTLTMSVLVLRLTHHTFPRFPHLQGLWGWTTAISLYLVFCLIAGVETLVLLQKLTALIRG